MLLSLSNSSMSLCVSEKKATSDPDAIAEHSNKANINIKQKTTLADIPMKKGSAVTTDSRHIRGSIEAISKIKIFKLRVQRYEKIKILSC